MENIEFHRLIPPPEAFKYRLNGSAENQYRTSGNLVSVVTRVEYPMTGGMLLYHEGLKYPDKGIRYDEEMAAVDFVKGLLLTLVSTINPFNLFSIRKTMGYFIKTSHNILRPHILNDRFIKQSTRDMLALVNNFLYFYYPNMHPEERMRWGEVISSLIEFDSAYDTILKDLFLNTTYKDLLNQPIREIWKMARLFKERAPLISHKFVKMAGLMSLALLLPDVRICFRFTLEKLGRKPFEMDDADRYMCLAQTFYKFFGMTEEEKRREWIKANDGKDIPYCFKIK